MRNECKNCEWFNRKAGLASGCDGQCFLEPPTVEAYGEGKTNFSARPEVSSYDGCKWWEPIGGWPEE